MGDFFAPPPGFPTPPPEPDIPPVDFATAGLNISKGLSQGPPLFGWLKSLLDMLLQWVATVVGWLVGLAGEILAFLVRNITKADEAAASGYADLVASELEALFGIGYNTAALQGVANAKNRADLGSQVAAAILQSIFAPTSAAGGSGIEPSDSAAKKFLGTVMTMEVEGWMHSWIFDALTYHELEKFGDLKDGIARVLGLGRMSRQVFAPPLKVFVHDPYLALLNQTYRPNHLAEPSAIRQFFRGELSRQDLSRILGRQGWSEQYIDFLINEHQKFLSDAEVEYLVSRGAWNPEQANKYLQEQGWDSATADRRLSILRDQKIDKYRREIISAAQEAFIRGDIPSSQFQTIVNASGLSDDEQTWLIRVAGTKRELHITNLSRGDIQTMILKGILNFGDLQQWAIRNNMPIDQERFLELLLAEEGGEKSAAAKAKATAAAAKAAAAQQKQAAAVAKAAAAKAQAADKGISVSEAETLVLDGIWTFDHLTTYLAARGYSADAIDAISHLLHTKLAKVSANQTAASATKAAAASKGLNLATMEKATIDGIITIADFERYLAAQGFDQSEIAVLVELTQHAIDVQRAKDQAAAARAARAGQHAASLAEIERAARLGITAVETYTSALQNAGFDAASVALLKGILDQQMAADKAAAAKRGAAVAAAGKRGISLPQLEQEVISGIRPIGDYTGELAALNYSADDQQDLTRLLQLRVDAAAIAAEKRTAAGTQLAARSLSLPDVERAVKLQVLTIDDYRAALKAAGFDAHSIDILAHTLTNAVAQTAVAQQSTNAAGAIAKAKSISLANEQRAVLEGLKPISEYSAMLAQLGYSVGDIATMAELLQLKIDQAATGAVKHADAVGLATQRGISLAAEEQAVIDGVRTMQDYDSLLGALGFDGVDRATLEDLLQVRTAAAAAKAAKAAAGASGTGAPAGGAQGGQP